MLPLSCYLDLVWPGIHSNVCHSIHSACMFVFWGCLISALMFYTKPVYTAPKLRREYLSSFDVVFCLFNRVTLWLEWPWLPMHDVAEFLSTPTLHYSRKGNWVNQWLVIDVADLQKVSYLWLLVYQNYLFHVVIHVLSPTFRISSRIPQHPNTKVILTAIQRWIRLIVRWGSDTMSIWNLPLANVLETWW